MKRRMTYLMRRWKRAEDLADDFEKQILRIRKKRRGFIITEYRKKVEERMKMKGYAGCEEDGEKIFFVVLEGYLNGNRNMNEKEDII